MVSADSLGWYRAELPVGVYRASVSLSRNANYSDNLDTVSVGRAVRRKDFPRGRARVTVALPSELAGTETSLRLQNGNFRADVRADVIDSLAVFDFRLLPPIAFTMRLTTGNDRSDVLLPGTYDAEQADSLRVGTGDVAHYADMRPMHILISGHVMGSWTLGSAEMWVAAVMPFGAIRSDVMCEPDGSFRIHLFAPERIRFRSRCNNVDQWFGGNRFHTATPYDLQAGDHLTDLLLVEGGLRIRTERADQLVFDRSAEVQLVVCRRPHAVLLDPESAAVPDLEPRRRQLSSQGRRLLHRGSLAFAMVSGRSDGGGSDAAGGHTRILHRREHRPADGRRSDRHSG